MLGNTVTMNTRPNDAQRRPRGRYDASRPPLRLRSVVRDCAVMDRAGQRVRRHIRAARELRGWNQIDLAREADVSRGTIQRLEDGVRLSEGKESKIESALRWRLGSLDAIREGGEPTPILAAAKPLATLTEAAAFAEAERIVRQTEDESEGYRFVRRWRSERRAADAARAEESEDAP